MKEERKMKTEGMMRMNEERERDEGRTVEED